jgi:hypothetical protein
VRLGVSFNPPQDFRNILRVIEVHAIQAQRAIEKVRMAIGESGQKQPTAGIDDSSLAAAIGFDILRTPDREDLVPVDRNRLRPSLPRIHRIYAGIHH